MKIISEYAGDDSELGSLLVSWLDIKEQRSQPINPESIRLNLEELTRITAGSDKKAYLREVIRRGWGTFFELERKPSKQGGGKCISRLQNRTCTDFEPHLHGFMTAPLPESNRAKCISRPHCHSCTEFLPHFAGNCPRSLPEKHQAGSK